MAVYEDVVVNGLHLTVEEDKLSVDLTYSNLENTKLVQTLKMLKQQQANIYANLVMHEMLGKFDEAMIMIDAGLLSRAQEFLWTYPLPRALDLLDVAQHQTFWSIADHAEPIIRQSWQRLSEKCETVHTWLQLKPYAAKYPHEHKGFVYLFWLSSGHYKIGLSINPKRRGRQSVSGLPLKLKRIHQIPCNQIACLEEVLHDQYQKKRIENTEWFELTEQDVAEFCAIKQVHYEWIDDPSWFGRHRPRYMESSVGPTSSIAS